MLPGTNWWDAEIVTSNALKKWTGLIHPNTPTGHHAPLAELARLWRTRGKKISSLKELILCYYSGFKIICIPAVKFQSPSLIKQQYQKLHDEIKRASENSRKARKSSGLLMSSEELEYYLEHAFDHFSKHPTAPFNFLSAALLYNPVTTTFKHHICTLTVYLMACFPNASGRELFRKIAPPVASSIFLSAHRSRYPRRRMYTATT